MHTHQNGNVLFLILIAVALFAALSYAVTKSTSGGGGVSSEKAALTSAQMIQQSAAFSTAIMRLQIMSSCSDTQISFENSTESGYTNATAPASKECHLFDPAGGGLSWQTTDNNMNDGSAWYFSAIGDVPEVGPVVNADELVVMLFNVNDTVCQTINKELGIGNTIPVDGGDINEAKFTGTYGQDETLSGSIGALDCSVDPLCGQHTGCFKEENSGERNVFYHVLIPR